MLEIRNITKIYQNKVLDNISINFRKNEFVSILGPSGSGKTTLLNIIGGLDKYNSGDIIVNGKSTKKFNDKSWNSYRSNYVGFIFQNYNLINHISVYKNIELVLDIASRKNKKSKVMKYLKMVGLEKYANRKVNELSGGQMQRVAIARALVNNPDIILADEPTGALDSKTSIEIIKIIKKISKSKLVIMVTHNKDLAKKYSDRIISLKDGKVINDTNPLYNIYTKDILKLKKTKMNYRTAILLSINNIRTKRSRTIITSLASSIGIIGIALILAISNGFKKQLNGYEKSTLSMFPITITNKYVSGKNNRVNKKEYSKAKKLYLYEKNYNIHSNQINDSYVKYISNNINKYTNLISYERINNFNLVIKTSEYKTSQSNLLSFYELPSNNSFLINNYDLLYGSYPKNKHDLVIITNSKNEINSSIIDFLGIDKLNINFNNIVGKKMKIINNDNYYEYYNDMFFKKKIDDELYDNSSNITLKIVGIIRGKKDNDLSSIIEGLDDNVSKIGYNVNLINEMVDNNKNSIIVNKQKTSDNIYINDDIILSKEEALTYLNENKTPKLINIYPSSFENKKNIIKYLDNYNKNFKNKVYYTDYAKQISKLSNNIINGITITLLAFSSISLLISSIMIGIITYISVLERTKEIGILRSLGARKKDIVRVFNSEVLIIGISSGLIGILLTQILLLFINQVLYKLTGIKNIGILDFKDSVILILISVILTLIGGYIPSKKASNKNPATTLRS